jgi:hypothetical protein
MSNINSQELLEAGLALIKIPFGTKGPTMVGWNLRNNTVRDPRQSNVFKGFNVGIAHAYCSPTPTCAIDIDNYKTAKPWLAMYGIDIQTLLMAQDAIVIWSGKKYSIKLLYRIPINTDPLETKKIVGSDGLTALEFRCASKDGKTVQDVLPPSRHPDGHDYKWIGQGNPLSIPVIPSELLAVWIRLIANTNRVALRPIQGLFIHHLRQETPREVATIKSALNRISADCEYEKWRNIIWAALSTGWLCAEDIALNWSKTAPERFEEDAFWLVTNSYIPNHSSQISVGTIYHHARLGGWNG